MICRLNARSEVTSQEIVPICGLVGGMDVLDPMIVMRGSVGAVGCPGSIEVLVLDSSVLAWARFTLVQVSLPDLTSSSKRVYSHLHSRNL